MTTTKKPNAFGGAVNKLSDFQKQKAVQEGERIIKVNPGEVECKPQIRGKQNPGFTQESLMELGDDIEQNGQAEPAILRPHPNPESGFKYLMVAGERRQRSCALKGLLLEAVVRDLTDAQAKRIQRAENVQRENLTQLEVALALKGDKEELGTLQAVADEWKKSVSWVAERLAYLDAVEQPGASRTAVQNGVTADISVVNDLARLERLDQAAAVELVQRAEEDPDLNLRNEVRTQLRTTKALRIKPGGKTKPAKPAANTDEDTELDVLKEQNAVLAEQVKALEAEKEYLTQELEKARQQIAEQWKPTE
ncbi:ParB/RepB/Spo0J family partition protein [Pseudomonas proteolytica]|jgi:ParB family chromosome partitioning protein|uniref:ParB/RepB/Spo0J family partition protein n=1 Tax=Pseudomonas proteolytica TaxID=219574 RepID=A0AAW5A9L6_9PSED|nr:MULTISPECIES: ParB/RepB/Spo0J family partition protein [Pseudomonas]MCF5059270.1 ParB/RepB/Spo0J family partition protein [Pseudomonas proteolytica]MCF5101664.1 ParB/RepB/Spo0J family partition protein [Pseudomonas proteolytica]